MVDDEISRRCVKQPSSIRWKGLVQPVQGLKGLRSPEEGRILPLDAFRLKVPTSALLWVSRVQVSPADFRLASPNGRSQLLHLNLSLSIHTHM